MAGAGHSERSFPRLAQVYFGVSFFGQLRTSEVVAQLKTSADKSDNTRSHVQKVHPRLVQPLVSPRRALKFGPVLWAARGCY